MRVLLFCLDEVRRMRGLAGAVATMMIGCGGAPFSAPDHQAVDGMVVSMSSADGGDGASVCRPFTCSELGYDCGMTEDGCGHPIDCGKCSAPDAAPTTCTGSCKPTSVSGPIGCRGNCMGTCFGQCNGATTPADGISNCSGTCNGTCSGTCLNNPGAGGAPCSGICI